MELKAARLGKDNNYDSTAWFYEKVAHLFSGGQILACKRSQVPHFIKGEKVLFAGSGGGEDALLALNKGSHVSIVELSGKMIDQAAKKFKAHPFEKNLKIHHKNIFDYQSIETYDVVVANFFLNVFKESDMSKALNHLVSLLRPGGKLIIGDFSPPSGGAINKFLQKAHFKLASLFFHLLTNNPIHPIYKYQDYFEENGLVLIEKSFFTPLGLISDGYYSLVTVKRN